MKAELDRYQKQILALQQQIQQSAQQTQKYEGENRELREKLEKSLNAVTQFQRDIEGLKKENSKVIEINDSLQVSQQELVNQLRQVSPVSLLPRPAFSSGIPGCRFKSRIDILRISVLSIYGRKKS